MNSGSDSCPIRAFALPLEKLNSIASERRKTELGIAMALSTDLEYPFSWSHIEKECNMDMHFQRVYGVCLGKKEAIELIKDYAAEDISIDVFLKRYTNKKYEDFFAREAAMGERRAMLATHAEWLHLYGYTNDPLSLPNGIAERLPSDWSSQRENMIRKYSLSPTLDYKVSK